MTRKDKKSGHVGLGNAYLTVDKYINSLKGLSSKERSHLRGLIENGRVVPEAVIGKSAKAVKGILARNLLSAAPTLPDEEVIHFISNQFPGRNRRPVLQKVCECVVFLMYQLFGRV